MEPEITIDVEPRKDTFLPEEEIQCTYRVRAEHAHQVQALEVSLLWYTEGKGEEDLGVQYFERHVAADAERGDLRGTRSFRATLPPSPLSYEGVIVKVRWCVRVRLFLRRGRSVTADVPLCLGLVPPGMRLDEAEAAMEADAEEESPAAANEARETQSDESADPAAASGSAGAAEH